MGANAGGANVKGVQSIEQGTLTQANITITVTATGAYSTVLTVPTGHVWIYKGCKSYRSTGTFTVTGEEMRINPSGGGGTNMAVAIGTTVLQSVTTTTITVPAGGKIEFYLNVPTTFVSSGDEICSVLYQDIII